MSDSLFFVIKEQQGVCSFGKDPRASLNGSFLNSQKMKQNPSLGDRRTQKTQQRYQALSRSGVGAYYKALEVLTSVSSLRRQGDWEQLTALKVIGRGLGFVPLSSCFHQSLVYQPMDIYGIQIAGQLSFITFASSKLQAKYGLALLFKSQQNLFFFPCAVWLLFMANNDRQDFVYDEMSREKKLKILILFVRVAFEPRAFTVRLLRLLLNFMNHKPHRNKEREQLCYFMSVVTGAVPPAPQLVLTLIQPLHQSQEELNCMQRLSRNIIRLKGNLTFGNLGPR